MTSMNFHIKPRAAIGAMLLSASLACAGCNDAKSAATAPDVTSATPKTVTVTVAPAETREVQRRIPVVGTLHGLEKLQIGAKVAGRIEKLHVDVGDRVAPGAVLFEINDKDYRLAVDEAQRALEKELAKLGLMAPPDERFDIQSLPSMARSKLLVENAKRKHERLRKLADKGTAVAQELEQADTDRRVEEVSQRQVELDVKATLAAVRYQQSVLDTAQRRLADTKVLAPPCTFGSLPAVNDAKYVVSRRMATAGELASASSTMLFELIVDDALKLKASVPERFASEVQVGQTVEVTVESRPGEIFEAKVYRLSPAVDSESRTFEVEALVPNKDHRLRHGCFAKAAILTRVDKSAVTVPLESLVSFAGVTKVFCVEDGAAREVVVDLGLRGPGWVEVSGNLHAGATVVTSGQFKLVSGSPVTIREPVPVTASATSRR